MICEILTFQFAHNYGALLQCYALKKYLRCLGIQVSVSDFTPDAVKGIYKLWPALKLNHPRSFIAECRRTLRRREQYNKFNDFIRNELCDTASDNPEYLILGSDQIWNEKITGEISEYYGTQYHGVAKIAYAGSFGRDQLSQFQKENVLRYFPSFKSISLREKCNVKEVQKLIHRPVECVLDPVFLLDQKEWEDFETPVKCLLGRRYILYYALREDKKLIQKARELSKSTGWKLVAIHPTCQNAPRGFMQVTGIAPKEFVYLVHHAELVCTNSFHAMSFSQIFGKKAVYKPYAKDESRVPTILEFCAMQYEQICAKEYDFSQCDTSKINEYKIYSKNFLKKALGVGNE